MVTEDKNKKNNSSFSTEFNQADNSINTDSFSRIKNIYKEILDNLVDGVLCVSLSAEIIFANRAVYEILLEEPPNLIGRSLYEFLPQESRKILVDQLKRRAAGFSSQYQIEIEVKGAKKLIAVRAQPVFKPDGAFDYSLVIVTEITEQERLKAQLQETEFRLTHIFANISEGLLVINADNQIVMANYAASRIFEIQPGQLVGMKLDQIFDKSQMKFLTFEHTSYQAPGSNKYEVELTLANGKKKYLIFSINSEYNSKGEYTGAFGIVSDVTEAKQTERLLKERERLYTRSQQVANIGYIEFDLTTREVKGSPQMYKIYELKPNQPLPCLDEYVKKYVHPDDLEKYKKDYDKLLNGETVFTNQRIVTNLGNVKYIKAVLEPEFNPNGELIKVFSTVFDETELQVTKLSQIEFEERFYTIFQYAPDAIVITNIETSEILAANRNIYRVLGYKPEELIGKRVLDLNIWTTLNHRNTLIAALRRDKKILNFSTELFNKNGDKLNILLSAEFIEINNKPCGMFILHDITDLIKSQKALIESEEKFRTLIEQMNEGLIITDRFNKIIYCNDQVCNSFNRKRTDLINKDLADFDFEVIGPISYQEFLNNLRAGHNSKLEFTIKTGEGKKVYINLSSKPMFKRGEYNGAINIASNITELKLIQFELQEKVKELESTLEEVKTLSGLLPICSYCKKIRNDQGYWQQLEDYISTHTDAKFTHSICNECMKKLL